MLVTKRELEQYYPEHYQEQLDIEYERQRKIVKERNKRRKKAKTARKLLGIGSAIVGMGICLFVLIGYVNITKMNHEIMELQNQKLELTREKEDLIAELEAVKSPAKVQEDALDKLGMDYATEEQLVYIDVEELDFLAISDSVDVADQHPVVQRFKDVFNVLSGYFRRS